MGFTTLAQDGAAGAQRVIEEITAELKRVMDLTGSADISRIDPAVIHRRQTPYMVIL
jgi:isopentenyl diphosphate isomerase/L-lactate dehydrogenase-like FMN-dependent dehydrogenase